MKSETVSARQWLEREGAPELGVGGAALLRLHTVLEKQGQLTVGEIGKGLPFVPRRFFVISRMPDVDIRGEHAHRELHQLLVCLAGSVIAEVGDGERNSAVLLDCPQVALHIPPMVWGAQHHYSSDAVLLVLASSEYDPGDYIRDFDEFAALRGKRDLR